MQVIFSEKNMMRKARNAGLRKPNQAVVLLSLRLRHDSKQVTSAKV